jgi:hypothetical protein
MHAPGPEPARRACALPWPRREVLKVFERNLMFERKEGKVYSFEELGDAFSGWQAGAC